MKNYHKGGFVEPPKQKEIIFPTASPYFRTCEVDRKKALFHKWAEYSEIVPPSPFSGGHAGGTVSATMGIVEYEDGTIGRVYPERIQFLDNEFQNYCFKKGNENEKEIE